MDLSDGERSTLFSAAAESLRFNAPLGGQRAEQLIDELRRFEPRTVVDLGCGRGGLVRLIAARLPESGVIGVDIDRSAIESARRLAAEAGLGDRVRFDLADAATWTGPVDAAFCVGASHAFGGPAPLMARLAELVPTGTAVIGDGVWETRPDTWCLVSFGELPNGIEGMTAPAEAAGWTVASADLSTLTEWDAFEQAWVEGVRAVGTPTAHAFADERAHDYITRYRRVLGFCWMVLSRSSPDRRRPIGGSPPPRRGPARAPGP